jgi:SdpC family antimicrobial peptide
MRNRIVGAVIAATVVAGGVFTAGPGANAVEHSSVRDMSAIPAQELIEGVVFLQGNLGERLIDNGALGDLSTSAKTELRTLLDDSAAQQLARDATAELLDEDPAASAPLTSALEARNPVAVSAALKGLVSEVTGTKAARVANSMARTSDATYIPGEIGPDCLFNVAVGGYLVIAVAAVAIGVVALASVAVVGSVKVAGKNAGSKQVGAASSADDIFVAALLKSV